MQQVMELPRAAAGVCQLLVDLHLAVADESGLIRVFHRSGELYRQRQFEDLRPHSALSGGFMAVAAGTMPCLWHLASDRLESLPSVEFPLRRLTLVKERLQVLDESGRGYVLDLRHGNRWAYEADPEWWSREPLPGGLTLELRPRQVLCARAGWLVLRAEGGLCLFQGDSLVELAPDVDRAALSEDGTWLLVGSLDGKAALWEVEPHLLPVVLPDDPAELARLLEGGLDPAHVPSSATPAVVRRWEAHRSPRLRRWLEGQRGLRGPVALLTGEGVEPEALLAAVGDPDLRGLALQRLREETDPGIQDRIVRRLLAGGHGVAWDACDHYRATDPVDDLLFRHRRPEARNDPEALCRLWYETRDVALEQHIRSRGLRPEDPEVRAALLRPEDPAEPRLLCRAAVAEELLSRARSQGWSLPGPEGAALNFILGRRLEDGALERAWPRLDSEVRRRLLALGAELPPLEPEEWTALSDEGRRRHVFDAPPELALQWLGRADDLRGPLVYPKPVELAAMSDPHATSVAFSPDGRGLATAGNRTLRLWDVRSGTLLKESQWQDPNPGGEQVAFYPGGIVTAGHFSFQLWNEHGQLLHTQPGFGYPVRLHGPWIAAVGPEGEVAVFERESRRPLWQRSVHGVQVTDLVFSPDGRWLATADRKGQLGVWQTRTGEQVAWLEGQAEFLAVAFSRDGRRLLAGTGDRKGNTILMGWDRTLMEWEWDRWRSPRIVPGAWTVDRLEWWGERLVASGRPSRVFRGEKVELQRDGVLRALSPELLALRIDGGELGLFDAGGELRARLPDSNDSWRRHNLAFSPDGSLLAMAGEPTRLWRVLENRPLRDLDQADLDRCPWPAVADLLRRRLAEVRS